MEHHIVHLISLFSVSEPIWIHLIQHISQILGLQLNNHRIRLDPSSIFHIHFIPCLSYIQHNSTAFRHTSLNSLNDLLPFRRELTVSLQEFKCQNLEQLISCSLICVIPINLIHVCNHLVIIEIGLDYGSDLITELNFL